MSNAANFTRYHQFEKMRKENNRLYWAPATQTAMQKLAEKYGESFYEGYPSSTNTNSNPQSLSANERKERMEALAKEWEQLRDMDTDATNNEGDKAAGEAE